MLFYSTRRGVKQVKHDAWVITLAWELDQIIALIIPNRITISIHRGHKAGQGHSGGGMAPLVGVPTQHTTGEGRGGACVPPHAWWLTNLVYCLAMGCPWCHQTPKNCFLCSAPPSFLGSVGDPRPPFKVLHTA